MNHLNGQEYALNTLGYLVWHSCENKTYDQIVKGLEDTIDITVKQIHNEFVMSGDPHPHEEWD